LTLHRIARGIAGPGMLFPVAKIAQGGLERLSGVVTAGQR
jgi:hypothetical protein